MAGAETDVAGPCCIQADIIAHRRLLPPLKQADELLIHDVGGYYHSGHSRYNLRQAPAVYAFESNIAADQISVKLIQAAETVNKSR